MLFRSLTRPLTRSLKRSLVGESGYVYDPDALDYIVRVEIADGEPLEPAVKVAINDLFLALKATPAPIASTQWDAILAGTALLMAGPRTLAGALVPLSPTMPSPTNVNFVGGDYNRVTGLKGDAVGKYLDSNLNSSSIPQSDIHLSSYISNSGTGGSSMVGSNIGVGTGTGASRIGRAGTGGNQRIFLAQSSSGVSITSDAMGLVGSARSTGTSLDYRLNGSSGSVASTVQTPVTGNFYLFSRNTTVIADRFDDSRSSFMSIGRSIDLTAMDSILTSYMNAITAALA